MGSKSNLDQKCIGYLGCSCSHQVALHHWKRENPERVLTISITLAKTNLFHNNPLLRSTRVLRSPARSRIGRCGHHRFCYLRYQETHNYHYAREKSPSPHSSSLPPQLISNSCPMPQVFLKAPAKLKETCLTDLLHNTLLSHAHLAHNCLTFWTSCQHVAVLLRGYVQHQQ